jgi:aspartyl-tRNA synthetase
MDWRKRVYCGDLSPSLVEKDVLLMGWVDAIRDHGNLLFIHLRDIGGIVQIVFDPQISKESYDLAVTLRQEWVIEVKGKISLREKGTENPNLETGGIEVLASALKLYSRSKPLPFQISEKAMVFGEAIQTGPEQVDEELRLQYRYLDLRRPTVQKFFLKRYEIIKCIREYLDELQFIEIETPFLNKSTPEGARDYLVPSRVHQGKFYALPQSPQLFKQILMMSGMDRYFQIARCFRDEDLRPNRQPEFTQLDLEASFIEEDFIYELIEELTVRMFSLGGIELPRPFPIMTYREAMERYGTDRPDLRFGMAFEDATDIVQHTGYAIFHQIIKGGGKVKGFCIKGMAEVLSKNVLQNEYALKIVPSLGAKGMTWMKIMEGKLESNIVQFFTEEEQEGLIKRFRAQDGDVILMIADQEKALVDKVLGSLRLHIIGRLGLVPETPYYPLWVTDFPLFELKEGKLSSQHHPFTMPDRTDFDPLDQQEMLQLNSRAYDLVLNGEELGGGSIRIHNMETQKKIFQALGLSQDEAEAKFGFFLKALEYGTPPHAGLALGLDRVVAMILNAPSIRDVIAFPKNRSALCPLTRAPSAVDRSQLHELGLDFSADVEEPSKRIRSTVQHDIASENSETAGRISEKEVKHVAKLARLKISDAEAGSLRKDLNAILEYVETLNELDTEEVHPMSHVLDLKNVWRDDKPINPKKTKELLSNAPMTEKNYYKVPKILES